MPCTDNHIDYAARCHAERPLPDDVLASAVAAWRDAARAGLETPSHLRAVVDALIAEGHSRGSAHCAGLAEILRVTPGAAIEVTRGIARVIHD